jgi:hypothetical protein
MFPNALWKNGHALIAVISRTENEWQLFGGVKWSNPITLILTPQLYGPNYVEIPFKTMVSKRVFNIRAKELVLHLESAVWGFKIIELFFWLQWMTRIWISLLYTWGRHNFVDKRFRPKKERHCWETSIWLQWWNQGTVVIRLCWGISDSAVAHGTYIVLQGGTVQLCFLVYTPHEHYSFKLPQTRVKYEWTKHLVWWWM